MALHAISLLTHGRLIDDIERTGTTQLIVLPPPCPLAIQPIDFGHADELIERGAEDAREFLETAAGSSSPIRMRCIPRGGRGARRPDVGAE